MDADGSLAERLAGMASLAAWYAQDGEDDLIIINVRNYRLMIDALLAVDAAGPWPRYNSTQYGRLCIDCGRQHDITHRDNCFGVAVAAALAGLEGAETTQNGSGRDEGDAHE